MSDEEELMLMIGNEYDESIIDLLMYQRQPLCASTDSTPILDSGKSGDKRIYRTLQHLEKVYKIKL